MKYIEHYKEQLEDNHINHPFYDTEIFKEYCALNCFLNSFERTDERLKELTVGDINDLTEEQIKQIFQAVEDLKASVNQLPKAFLELLNNSHVEGIIFMIGESTVDSHGIIINQQAYTIIDMHAYIKGDYDPASFLVHELTHALHYQLSPHMYFRNYMDVSDKLLKRIVLEGIATFTTKYYTDASDAEVFWLGCLEEDLLKQWMTHSTRQKEAVASKLNRLIHDAAWVNEDTYELFSVVDPNNLWKGRLAYFYGYEIAKTISDKLGLHALLEADYDVVLNELKHYFEI